MCHCFKKTNHETNCFKYSSDIHPLKYNFKQIDVQGSRKNYKFPLVSMGVLAPGSAHARPSFGPPSALAEIFWCTWLQSHLQTSPPTPQILYPKFRNPKTTFEIFKKNLKTPHQGAMGVLRFFENRATVVAQLVACSSLGQKLRFMFMYGVYTKRCLSQFHFFKNG
jgi:hypothetical protein